VALDPVMNGRSTTVSWGFAAAIGLMCAPARRSSSSFISGSGRYALCIMPSRIIIWSAMFGQPVIRLPRMIDLPSGAFGEGECGRRVAHGGEYAAFQVERFDDPVEVFVAVDVLERSVPADHVDRVGAVHVELAQ
jgi:hypothetical protein